MIMGSRLGCENESKGFFVYFHTCENKLTTTNLVAADFFSLIWEHLFHLTVYECRFRWEAIYWASYWILEKYGVEV